MIIFQKYYIVYNKNLLCAQLILAISQFHVIQCYIKTMVIKINLLLLFKYKKHKYKTSAIECNSIIKGYWSVDFLQSGYLFLKFLKIYNRLGIISGFYLLLEYCFILYKFHISFYYNYNIFSCIVCSVLTQLLWFI